MALRAKGSEKRKCISSSFSFPMKRSDRGAFIFAEIIFCTPHDHHDFLPESGKPIGLDYTKQLLQKALHGP